MSQADELLKSLNEGIAVASVDPETEPHIVIDNDRNITVPDELRRIAVQYDHNIETVTFDCPRYWDGHDLSAMTVYINYMRSDGEKGFFVAENIEIDENDTAIMHFTWTISKNVTMYKGSVSFLVCITSVGDEGNEELHWNSELCNQISVSEGLECHEAVEEEYPDIYTQLVDLVNANTFSDYYKDMIYKNASDIGVHTNEIAVLGNNVSSLQTGLSATVTRVTELESEVNNNYYNKTEVNTKFNEVNTNTNQKFATLEAQVNGVSGAVTELESEVDGLRASVNYMSEHKADTTTVNGVISDVSKLDDRVTANETAINSNTSNINAVDARVDSLFDADTQFSKDIASVNATATIAKTKAETALARNEFTDAEKSKLAGITNPMVIKGTVASVSDLPSTAEIGWFYFVGASDADVYDEYCYSQNGWEYVGTSQEGVDLSNYYNKTEINTKINEINTNTNQKFATLEAQVNGVSGAVTELKNDLDAAELVNKARFAEHTEDIDYLNTNVETNTTNIGVHTNEISVLNNNVSSLQTGLSATVTRVSTNETDIKTLKSNITTQNAVNADHIQRIKDNASGVAINKTTLGYQRKNLLSCPSYTKWVGSRTFTWDSEGYMTSTDANTTTDVRLWEYSYANRSIYLEAGTYTYSVHVKTAPTTGQNRVIGVDGNNNKLFQVDISDGAEINFTLTESKIVYLIEKVNNGSVAFMIRYADITDDTYEPYVDDVNTRIIENKNGIALNKTALGYHKKNIFNPSAANWKQPSLISIAQDGTITSAITSDIRQWTYNNADYYLTLEAGTYVFTSITETGGDLTYAVINGYTSNNTQVVRIYPNIIGRRDVTFTLTETTTIGFVMKLFTQTCKLMIRSADITDDTYEPYVKSVKERLDGQTLLYNNTSVSDSVLTVNISNLFADYSAVICNIVTSNGRYTQVLPLKYIKSLGTSTYYQAGEMIYYYVDDSNLKIYTGLGQSNPTISSAQIIGLY